MSKLSVPSAIRVLHDLSTATPEVFFNGMHIRDKDFASGSANSV